MARIASEIESNEGTGPRIWTFRWHIFYPLKYFHSKGSIASDGYEHVHERLPESLSPNHCQTAASQPNMPHKPPPSTPYCHLNSSAALSYQATIRSDRLVQPLEQSSHFLCWQDGHVASSSSLLTLGYCRKVSSPPALHLQQYQLLSVTTGFCLLDCSSSSGGVRSPVLSFTSVAFRAVTIGQR